MQIAVQARLNPVGAIPLQLVSEVRDPGMSDGTVNVVTESWSLRSLCRP